MHGTVTNWSWNMNRLEKLQLYGSLDYDELEDGDNVISIVYQYSPEKYKKKMGNGYKRFNSTVLELPIFVYY